MASKFDLVDGVSCGVVVRMLILLLTSSRLLYSDVCIWSGRDVGKCVVKEKIHIMEVKKRRATHLHPYMLGTRHGGILTLWTIWSQLHINCITFEYILCYP